MYLVTSVENQLSCWVPTNDVTDTIDYDMRFLITRNKQHPIAWTVSKREDVTPMGITKITFKQDAFNPNTDNVEELIADYYQSSLPPEEETEDTPSTDGFMDITYSGTKPQIKCGGSFKSFTCALKNNDGSIIENFSPVWKVILPEGRDKDFEISIDNEKLKIKCLPVYDLIGSVVTIQATDQSTNITNSIEVEVVGL